MNRKDEIIADLITARRRILEAASSVATERRQEVFLGTWSLMELLAHLIGWDYTNIDAVTDIRSGVSLRVFEHWDPDWVKYNAVLVEKHAQADFRKLLESINRSHKILIDYVRTIPPDEIVRDFGIRSPQGTNITVEWFLQFEIDDEGRHLQQIQEWFR